MAKKKSKKEAQSRPGSKKQDVKAAESGSLFESQYLGGHAPSQKAYFALFLIVIVSLIAYLPILNNGFVNWDDDKYVQNNPLIHSISLGDIFSTYVMGNYHPLTILTYAIEYHFFGLNASGYHVVSLLLHLLVVILVFSSVLLLSDKIEVALVASLLFGIHPVHMESVAWASELKDLLYVFFFLASYICYLHYIKKGQKRFYFYCLLWFLFSLLSKAIAASLPLVFLLTDYFKERKISRNVWLEKAPFFALAFFFGIIAIDAQQSVGAISVDYFSFPQRIVFASYSFITYLLKLLLPFRLCGYYSYPIKGGEDIPIQYYSYILLVIGLAAYVGYSLRYNKKIFFGFGFFTITVFFVLQLLLVGTTIMADRYIYLPSIGIFYLAGEGLVFLLKKSKSATYFRLPAMILLAVAVIFYSSKTYGRCFIWKNSMIFWSDVINQDSTIPVAYYDRGCFLENEKKYEDAIIDFNKAVDLKPDYTEVYLRRGILFKELKRYQEAINDYNKAIQLKPDLADAYNNRGIIFNELQRYQEAIDDYSQAIRLKPAYVKAYNNRGIIFSQLNRYKESLSDYNKVIELEPDFAEAYNNRGIVFSQLNRHEEALTDFNKAIALKPDFADAFIDRGHLLKNEKKYEDAISDYSKVILLRPDLMKGYFSRGVLYNDLKRFEEAFNDFNKVIELQPDYGLAYYSRGIAAFYLGKRDSACSDFKHASGLGYQEAIDAYSNFCR